MKWLPFIFLIALFSCKPKTNVPPPGGPSTISPVHSVHHSIRQDSLLLAPPSLMNFDLQGFHEFPFSKAFDTSHFSFLKQELMGRRIVALGESSHGFGKLFGFKSDLVKYLHEYLDYDVILLESGMGDVNMIWHNRANLTPEQMRDSTVYPNFQCDEIMPLFNYLKENSDGEDPLIYGGYDSQPSSTYFRNMFLQTMRDYISPGMYDTLKTGLQAYDFMFSNADTAHFNQQRDLFRGAAFMGGILFEENRKSIKQKFNFSDFQLDVITRTLMDYNLTEDYAYQEVLTRGNALRDSFMFLNTKWLIDSFYADKKVMIWAHNAHIEKAGLIGDTLNWMGHKLKEYYGEEYFSIGMFCHKGKYLNVKKGKIFEFDIDKDEYLEFKMKNMSYKNKFINLHNYAVLHYLPWLTKPLYAFEPEDAEKVHFVPDERFDALFLLLDTGPPTFN